MSSFASESEGRQIGGFRPANLCLLCAQGRHFCQQIGALFQRPVNEPFHGFLQAVGQRQTGKINNANRRGWKNANALGQGYLGVSFLGERLFEVESGLGRQLARSGYVRRSRQTVLETLFRSFLDLQGRIQRSLGGADAAYQAGQLVESGLNLKDDLLGVER